MEDCIFCKIVAGDIPCTKIYEDENVLAFLDITPTSPGHTLVIPKKHYPSFAETPDEVLEKLVVVVKIVSNAVVLGTEAKGFNLNLNNGKAAGQIVDHAHYHIIPRTEGDGLELWHGKEYAEGEAETIAAKIKGAIK